MVQAKTQAEVAPPDIQPFLDYWDGNVEFSKHQRIKDMNLPAIWDGTEWITEELNHEEYYDLTEHKTWQDLVERTMPDRQADLQELISESDADPEVDFFYGPFRTFRIVPEVDPFDNDQFLEEL